MKRVSLLVVALVAVIAVSAQSLEDGKRFLNYERYKSAKETFEKMVSSNPNNVDAVYWLGQTYLSMPVADIANARRVYQSALQSNGNAPLLIAGIGHVELLENKMNDARQRFETAISLTGGKDIKIFNAVGRANMDAKAGDKNYAIEKLNAATQVKGFKDPETFMLLGDTYRKLIDGGNAVTNYEKALGLDPAHARAHYMQGKIYESQKNTEVFLDKYIRAINADAAFAPAYFRLYDHYSYRDVNKAKDYLEKYIANADKECATEMYFADYLFRAGKYQESLNKVDELSAGICSGDPRLLVIKSYNHDRLGDTISARNEIESFLSKEDPAKVQFSDYEHAAKVLSRFPGQEVAAAGYYQKIYDLDTVEQNKFMYLARMAELFKKAGNRAEEARILGVVYNSKKTPTNNDLYNWAIAHYNAANYKMSDSLFTLYKQKYPDQVFGYLWSARSRQAIDTSMKLGLAVPAYEELITFAQTDTVKYKSQLLGAYGYLVPYYVNEKKDIRKGIFYMEKYVALDPANQQATKTLEQLRAALNRPPSPAPKPPAAKPGTKPATKPAGTKPAASKPPAKGTKTTTAKKS